MPPTWAVWVDNGRDLAVGVDPLELVRELVTCAATRVATAALYVRVVLLVAGSSLAGSGQHLSKQGYLTECMLSTLPAGNSHTFPDVNHVRVVGQAKLLQCHTDFLAVAASRAEAKAAA